MSNKPSVGDKIFSYWMFSSLISFLLCLWHAFLEPSTMNFWYGVFIWAFASFAICTNLFALKALVSIGKGAHGCLVFLGVVHLGITAYLLYYFATHGSVGIAHTLLSAFFAEGLVGDLALGTILGFVLGLLSGSSSEPLRGILIIFED